MKKGYNPSKISSNLNISIQNLYYYLKKLKEKGVINKIGYGTWEVDNDKITALLQELKTKSLGTMEKESANLHALTIEIPIISGTINLKALGGYEQEALRGWKPTYKKVLNPLGLTIKNNNNKSLSVYVWSRQIFNTFDIHSLITRTFNYVLYEFKKEGVILSWDYKVSTLHLSMPDKELSKIVNKGMKIEVPLGREAEKITPRDETREAKAWIDSSPYLGIETDDISYLRNKILMPENISNLTKELTPTIKELNYNLKTHIAVLKGIERAFNKFNSKLSQERLSRWL